MSFQWVYAILNAINIVKDVEKDYKYDVESILYAFASKFLNGKDLERVKGELRMTELGRSLMQEGEKKKAIEIARNLLDILSIEMIAKKTGLTLDEVKKLKEEVDTEKN